MKRNKQYLNLITGLIALVLCVLLISGCGGSGNDDKADDTSGTITPTATTISGTVATGAAIVGAEIAIKDFNGEEANGTTGGQGKFSIELPENMAPPYLLRANNGSSYLYSTIDIVGAGTANIHPYTDLIVRSYYAAESIDVDQAYDTISENTPIPSEAEIDLIKRIVKEFLKRWLIEKGIDVPSFDIISTPFEADGTEFDAILDKSAITDVGGDTHIIIDSNTTNITQTTIVSIENTSNSMTIESEVSDGNSTSTNQATATIILTEGDVVDNVVSEVNKTLNQIKLVINTQGNLLSYSHLTPFYHTNYLENGYDTNQDAKNFAEGLRGETIEEFVVDHVIEFNEDNGKIKVAIKGKVVGESSEFFDCYFKLEGNEWLMFGNQEKFYVRAASYIQKMYYENETITEKVLNIEAHSGLDIFIDGSVSGGSIFDNEPLNYSLALADDFQIYLRHDVENDFPPAGTEFSVTVTTTDGIETKKAISNATTDESFECWGPSGHSLNDANLGGTLTMNWSLPKTFLIQEIKVSATLHNANDDRTDVDSIENLTEESTTATITMPDLVNGESVTRAWVRVRIIGTNGEKTATDWRFQ